MSNLQNKKDKNNTQSKNNSTGSKVIEMIQSVVGKVSTTSHDVIERVGDCYINHIIKKQEKNEHLQQLEDSYEKMLLMHNPSKIGKSEKYIDKDVRKITTTIYTENGPISAIDSEYNGLRSSGYEGFFPLINDKGAVQIIYGKATKKSYDWDISSKLTKYDVVLRKANGKFQEMNNVGILNGDAYEDAKHVFDSFHRSFKVKALEVKESESNIIKM